MTSSSAAPGSSRCWLTHPVFKDFIKFYFPLVSTTRGSVNMKLTELARLKVAEKNECAL